MRKLSEYKDGSAIDKLAEMLGPLISMSHNKEFMEVMDNKGATRLEKIQAALRMCTGDIIAILAILNETPVEHYHCSIASILADMATLFSDEEFMSFFESQGQKNSNTISGSATENTEVAEA